ncbi:Lin0512 family protein [Halomonas piscis]|nr:Lin0512 family protein [Halomonas piscis]
MANAPLVHQFGTGTSIRSRDYTAACVRAIRDALWHNSLSVAEVFDSPREAMMIDVQLGIPRPEEVDTRKLPDVFPYGKPRITLTRGGLEILKPDGSGASVIANAVLTVSLARESDNG